MVESKTRRQLVSTIGATSIAMVAGCSGGGSSTNKPPLEPPDLDGPLAERYESIERETVYREIDGQQLRVVAALPAVSDGSPVLMHFHGGAFRYGGPGYDGMEQLARAGIAVISVEYRLSGTATFPAAIRDVIASIQWVQANEPEWSLNPNRVALTGDSAGAHLAALAAAATDHPNFQPENYPVDTAVSIDALIPHYGIYDFRPAWVCERDSTRVPVTEFLGESCASATDLRAEASPVAHIDSDHPPVLLFHGTEDQTLPIKTARSYRDALSAAGISVDYREFEGVGHAYFVRDSNRKEEAFQESHRRKVRMLFEGPWSDI